MKIREAVSSDAADLSDLATICYRDAFGHSFEHEDLAAYVDTNLAEERFRDYVTDDTVLVAEEGERLAGFVQFGELLDPDMANGHPCQEIRRLYVRPELQRRGYGTALMDLALAHPGLRSDQDVVLDVWIHNKGARRFYERYGFRVTGLREFRVRSGAETSPDLVMILSARSRIKD